MILRKKIILALKRSILIEFEELLRQYGHKEIYSCVLCIDDDFISSYLVLGCIEDIKSINRKWTPGEWSSYLTNDMRILNGMEDFSRGMYHNDILDCDRYQLYLEGFSLAISEIVKKHSYFKEIVFFLSSFGDNRMSIDTAKLLSKNIELLEEFLFYIRY